LGKDRLSKPRKRGELRACLGGKAGLDPWIFSGKTWFAQRYFVREQIQYTHRTVERLIVVSAVLKSGIPYTPVGTDGDNATGRELDHF
jgi:hypothetical protein